MRARTLIVLTSTAAIACGLFYGGADDTLGVDASIYVSVVDAGADTKLPLPCTTLDASACIGDASVPDGWSIVGVARGGKACPVDFTASALVAEPSPADGGCVCGACKVFGAYACDGPATVQAGNSCGNPVVVVDGGCVAATHFTIRATPPDASGAPTCAVESDAGSGQATGVPVSACTPTKCEVDFCGALADAGFKRCIVTEGSATCPPGFAPAETAGVGASLASCTCPACTVGAPPACTGSILTYGSNDCSGGANTYAANGQCNQQGNAYSSYKYVANAAPAPSCAPGAPAAGTASAVLVGPKTICCVP